MPGCIILNTLESRQERRGRTIYKTVAIIQTRCYKGVDDSFTSHGGEILPDPTDIINIVKTRRSDFTDLGRYRQVVVKPGI